MLLLFVIVFITSQTSFGSDDVSRPNLSRAIQLLQVKDYSNAIAVLTNIQRTKDNERTIDYYLCESYFLLNDYEKSLKYGESVIKKKNDFIYQKSLYNVVFSSYMLNKFTLSYNYGIEYLNNVGNINGVESVVITITFNSLLSTGNFQKASELIERYRNKYPNLYNVLLQTLESARSIGIKDETPTRSSQPEPAKEEKITRNTEEELELVRYIISSLERISSKRDQQIEKLNDILELLELKEEALKVKKYRLLLDE
ncbi:MAG: hypothetical protein RMJ37_06400 [Spirochaetia bacterium]|nr:hypothetical protein [Spirochaetota bacterium]MCX8096228.1 hypothetical protein [Spirochaetota bacterium]MDW8112944.1 hypothetical protein [Spirochaetia bacterium]